jgi:hypothetical protein
MRKISEDQLTPEQQARVKAFRARRRTPEARAEEAQVRQQFQRDKPSLSEVVAKGHEGRFRHGDVIAFLSAIARLKRERQGRGLTLAQVSERSGLDPGMLSRLENGKVLNPTISTLWRYAEAVGARVNLEIESMPAESKEAAV